MLALSRESLQRNVGGYTANIAIYLARLGRGRNTDVGFASGLGVDSVSDILLEHWQEEGLNTRCVMRIDNKLPGLYFVEKALGGKASPTIHYWQNDSAAKYYFTGDSSPLDTAVAQGDIDALYVSGVGLAVLKNESRGRLVMLMRQIKARGGKIFFDNAFCPQRWHRNEAIEWYSQILPLSDIVFLDESDEYLIWGDEQSIATRCKLLDCLEVVMRDANGNCTLWSKSNTGITQENLKLADINKPINAKQTKGAFFAAYLAERLLGNERVSAAHFAHKVAKRVNKCNHGLIPMTRMVDLL
ncbi:hypothetical protein A8L45_22160 [Veronia pacifica]|uniref:Carbohydrate kinase PfkB domain-containing protein n=2 Tax=Veronia pacifica TaxID=1080227 RepID=A0A1C3E879_9GAMM|nr:hypothetical protein A8L45_22160 [Veronia pacifica]